MLFLNAWICLWNGGKTKNGGINSKNFKSMSERDLDGQSKK